VKVFSGFSGKTLVDSVSIITKAGVCVRCSFAVFDLIGGSLVAGLVLFKMGFSI